MLFFFPCLVFAQNTIGLPSSINYSRQNYGAGLQNWDVAQDRNGLIYFANNEGMLSFDGKNWTLYPLPNKTIVHSVAIGADSRIYVGGQDELGYFEPSVNGRLQYHSLIDLIVVTDRSFGDVWDIVVLNGEVFFRSPHTIFKFNQKAISSYKASSEWALMAACHNQLYAHDYSLGLLRFSNNEWKPAAQKNTLPVNDAVTALLPAGSDSVVITTLKNGLFVFHQNKISKLSFANTSVFENERIYGATKINDQWLALATNNGGVYIVDQKGIIIQRFSKAEGLQNNNVLSIFLDNQNNLWLGLDTGIDFIAYNSAIKNINPPFQDGSGYAAIVFKKRLYIGTSNGLFSIPLQPLLDLSFSKGNFELVAGTKGQAWSLQQINGNLLLGHHEGAFLIKENAAINMAATPG
ncbi:MAG: two-component regulator propeller domain-containing protein, partial [Bacteroidota bacterium]